MAWVYILESEKNGRFYIGCTGNFERRIKEHLGGKTKSLKHLLPLRVVFKQEFPNFKTARKIENKLKKLKRKDYLEKIIKEGYLRMSP